MENTEVESHGMTLSTTCLHESDITHTSSTCGTEQSLMWQRGMQELSCIANQFSRCQPYVGLAPQHLRCKKNCLGSQAQVPYNRLVSQAAIIPADIISGE